MNEQSASNAASDLGDDWPPTILQPLYWKLKWWSFCAIPRRIRFAIRMQFVPLRSMPQDYYPTYKMTDDGWLQAYDEASDGTKFGLTGFGANSYDRLRKAMWKTLEWHRVNR